MPGYLCRSSPVRFFTELNIACSFGRRASGKTFRDLYISFEVIFCFTDITTVGKLFCQRTKHTVDCIDIVCIDASVISTHGDRRSRISVFDGHMTASQGRRGRFIVLINYKGISIVIINADISCFAVGHIDRSCLGSISLAGPMLDGAGTRIVPSTRPFHIDCHFVGCALSMPSRIGIHSERRRAFGVSCPVGSIGEIQIEAGRSLCMRFYFGASSSGVIPFEEGIFPLSPILIWPLFPIPPLVTKSPVICAI